MVQALAEAPAHQTQIQAMEQSLQRLVSLSLATPVLQGYWVHRWTAQALVQTAPEPDQHARYRRAGEFRLARGGGQGIEYVDICEATYNFLDAAEFDRACRLAGLADRQIPYRAAANHRRRGPGLGGIAALAEFDR